MKNLLLSAAAGALAGTVVCVVSQGLTGPDEHAADAPHAPQQPLQFPSGLAALGMKLLPLLAVVGHQLLGEMEEVLQGQRKQEDSEQPADNETPTAPGTTALDTDINSTDSTAPVAAH